MRTISTRTVILIIIAVAIACLIAGLVIYVFQHEPVIPPLHGPLPSPSLATPAHQGPFKS